MNQIKTDLKLINCDWLQLYCTNEDSLKMYSHSAYEVKSVNIQTRHFKIWEEIYQKGNRIATINRIPCSPILPKDMILVKFDNSFLYAGNLFVNVHQFLINLKLKLKSITRLDICLDFQKFNQFENPEKLLKNFLNGKYLKLGKSTFQTAGKTYIKIDKSEKNKYIIERENDIKILYDDFKISGKSNKSNKLQYIRFGGLNSNISYYLYNKTDELNEKTYKPYIVHSWELANYEKTNDVWRLEFTIKNSNAEIVDCETGEIKSLKSLEILKHENIVSVFWSLYDKYFQFVIKKGDSNKSRMKKLDLLTPDETPKIFHWDEPKKQSNRADKIFIKKMNSVNDELRAKSPHLLKSNKQLLENFIDNRDLRKWAYENGYVDELLTTKEYKYSNLK